MAALTDRNTGGRRLPRIALYGVGAILVLFVLMQFARFVIPSFRMDNPPVTATVNWDSPETRALWDTACADCHSNETIYPWYSYIAPPGWLIARHVNKGRDHLNVSTNHRIDLEEMVEVIRDGEMPLASYTLLHPDANLDDAQRETLIAGLQATFGNSAPADNGD